ncbi:MAG: hypothetical protein AABY03_02220 [Nanoarchaeota archaeon]
MECFKCGIQEERALLFDAISISGIVKICRRCSIVEDIPLIRVKTEQDIEEQRKVEKTKQDAQKLAYVKHMRGDDLALRRLVDSNFKKLNEDLALKSTLIDNFHWAMMRARRAKHLTQGQLANAIREPEIMINTLERGVVPEKSREAITKIENHLFVRLRKGDSKMEGRSHLTSLNSATSLRVSDLKDMTKIESIKINDDLRFEDKD